MLRSLAFAAVTLAACTAASQADDRVPTGTLRVTYIAGLATGAAATYLVEVFLRWRHQKKVATEATE